MNVLFNRLQKIYESAQFNLTSVATDITGVSGWAMRMGGVARRTRRQFIAQLPEYVQLVSAQMSANVSMEEALRRTAQAQSMVGKWMRKVLQMAQGRNLIEQMQREAQETNSWNLFAAALPSRN